MGGGFGGGGNSLNQLGSFTQWGFLKNYAPSGGDTGGDDGCGGYNCDDGDWGTSAHMYTYYHDSSGKKMRKKKRTVWKNGKKGAEN